MSDAQTEFQVQIDRIRSACYTVAKAISPIFRITAKAFQQLAMLMVVPNRRTSYALWKEDYPRYGYYLQQHVVRKLRREKEASHER